MAGKTSQKASSRWRDRSFELRSIHLIGSNPGCCCLGTGRPDYAKYRWTRLRHAGKSLYFAIPNHFTQRRASSNNICRKPNFVRVGRNKVAGFSRFFVSTSGEKISRRGCVIEANADYLVEAPQAADL